MFINTLHAIGMMTLDGWRCPARRHYTVLRKDPESDTKDATRELHSRDRAAGAAPGGSRGRSCQ